MKHSKTLIKVLGECIEKRSRWMCGCLILLLWIFIMIAANPANAYSGEEGAAVSAAAETAGTLNPVSPLLQQMKLSQPSPVVPGGRGYMLPQIVVLKDSSGNPISGVDVKFEVSSDDLITALMRGSNSKSITVATDANGVASAANTYSGYVGEGFQVYSKYSGVVKTLQVKASALGANTVTFNVEVGTYGSSIVDNTPPTITASAKDDTGANYIAGTWTNRAVTVHYTAMDTLSDIRFCTPDQVFANEGANQVASGKAIDSAAVGDNDINHTSSVTFGPINIDKTAPTTTAAATPATGDSWSKGTVAVRFDAADSVSGVESIYYKLGSSEPVKTTGSSATANVSTEGTNSISYWAVDKAGNAETAKTITVKIDQTSPTVTYTVSPEKNEYGWNNSDVTVKLTAADTNSGVKEIHYKMGLTGIEQIAQGQSAMFAVTTEGVVPVTFWAVDYVGNTSDVQKFDVKIDKTAPVIKVPDNITVEATAVNTPIDVGKATVTDVSPEVILTNDAPAGGFPIGATSVIWTAKDQVGNITSAVQTITVKDTTKPVLTVQGDIVVEATAVRTRLTLQKATAIDIFPVIVTSDAPEDFPVGTTPVTWTATDANNNSISAVQNVTVIDSTKPVLKVPDNITIEATGIRTSVPIGTATATDIFKVIITNDAPADYPVGTTKVAWKATDESGNISLGEQVIRVVDTIKPVFISVPEDITLEATAVRTPVNIGQATATDIFKVTIINDAPEDFPVGITTVTWTATDENNNVTTAQQKITVKDTTKPVLTVPQNITMEATAVRTPVTIGEATATDIFKVTITKSAPVDYPVGRTVVTWTATDENGNVSTGEQVITIEDKTKPLLSIPGDKTVEATAIRTPVSIGQATAIDIFKVTITNDAPVDYPLGTTTVTWTATDENGNVSTAKQNITVRDTTKPVLMVPADMTVEATAVRSQVSIGMATATDIFQVEITSDAPLDYPIGTTKVTWMAKDTSGNVSLGYQNIIVVDKTAPVLTLPKDVTIEATALRTPVTIGEATATDIFKVTITSDAPVDYPVGITKVTWTATDENGNVSKGVQNVTVTDTTKPVLTVPADMTVEATAVRTPVSIGMATATDIFKVIIVNNAPVDYPLGKTVVTWKATDANGNISEGAQVITIVDTTPPVVKVPMDITVEATGVKTPINLPLPEPIDIFGATVTHDAPREFPLGTTIITWSFFDPNGNVVTFQQKITVVDTTKPVLKVPADMTVEATAVRTPVNIGQATATDIFEVTIINDAPADYPIGTTKVTWTATDANGNISTGVQNVTIVDTTKPVITTAPVDKTVEATAIRTPVDIGQLIATDIFPITITNDAPIDYPVGITTVTWIVTDQNNNSITGEQKITVVDTTKPVLTVPEDMTVEATAVRTPVDIGKATATDIFDVTITNDAPVDYPIGTTKVTWKATDANGNISTKEQHITIIDTTKPVLTVPEDKIVEATAIKTPVDIGLATATDIFKVVITNDAPADYPIGNTKVTWKATDEHGNVTTGEQRITVIDTTKPVLKVPADITVEATAVRTPVNIGQATAADIFEVTITNDAPADYPIGTTPVTWTAIDANGNISKVIQNVTIVDTTKPVLELPLDITTEATAVRTPVDIGVATATDIFSVTITSDAPENYPMGTTKVKWTATDANGNVSTGEQSIKIVDTTKPVLTVPEDITVEATAIKTPVSIGTATATDIFKVTITNDALTEYPIGTTKVIWTAADENGNISTREQKITVVDTTKPVLTVPANMTVEATAVRTPVSIGMATATDIFSVTITSDAPADYPIGTTVVTWTATDANGNMSTTEQSITIVDTTKPVLQLPVDITTEATAVRTPVSIGTATATDIFHVDITNDAPVDYPVGTTNVEWTATDANANVSTGEQSITIVDTTKPVLKVPADVTVEATAIRTPVSIGEAIATDIFKVTITNDAPIDYPIGTTKVIWTATDEHGNVSTGEQKVTVVDTTKPVLKVPVDITMEATAVRTQVSIGTATATDIFDVTITSDAPADYPIGTTTVTWKATDVNGNTSTGEQHITIVDTTKPVLTVPGNKAVEATAIRTPVDIGLATATDIFNVVVTSDAPADYPIGTTKVTWTATDANSNISTGEQSITIVDTTKPVLKLPVDITKEATAVRTPVSIGQATATDIFNVTITNDAPADYPIGTTKVTWTATDVNGNVFTGEQSITIVDTTKPVLMVPEDMTVEAMAINTPVSIGTATATDIFGVTVTSDAPVNYPIGTTKVTWTAKDANGNVSTKEQNITIVDTTKPVITAPADMTVPATGTRTQVAIGTATATDIFGVTITNDAPVDFPIGTTVVTWKATDANGNISTAVQRITVVQKLKIQAYNNTRRATVQSIDPRIMIENIGQTTLNLSDITIRYYYTVDGEKAQNFWCDYAEVNTAAGDRKITSCVKGVLKKGVSKPGSDYYLEISFTSGAGTLKPGEKVSTDNRFAKWDWTTYQQTNDYSFNASATGYVESNKITVYLSGTLVAGTEP